MTPELLNKLKHLANIAAHLPHDVTIEDEDAAMKALHGELAADTVLQMIALAEHTLLAAAPSPSLAVRDGVDWKTRAEKSESRLAEIQRGVEKLQGYDKARILVVYADVLALLQPQG